MEQWLFVGILSLLGAIIGSFLNVVVYRLHTNRSLGGRSHCMSCGHTLRWFELIPVVSYLLQKGRCRACTARVTSRYLFVELLTGLLFALVAWTYTDMVSMTLLLILSALLVVILVYDILHTIIPDELVLALCVPASGLVLYRHILEGELMLPLIYAVLSALGASGFFAALWLISGGRWVGLGDAKLAFPLALVVGPLSTFSLVVLAFWIGAVLSLILLGAQRFLTSTYVRGKVRLGFLGYPLTIKSEVPFAPFLILSFFLVYLGGIDVFALIELLVPSF